MRMRRERIVTFLLGSALLAASAGAQEVPHLLADINRTPHVPFSTQLREEPSDLFELGGRLLFSTADPDSLDQAILWSTDGTARGTRQISTTLCPSPCTRISALNVQQGVALLGVLSDDSITRLGRTDGTPEGTYLLTDGFYADSVFQPLELISIPGRESLLFFGCVDNEECSLWQTDGTRAGTIPLGTEALRFSHPHGSTLWHGRLYFLALQGEDGKEGLWSTDGTPAGTLLVHAVQEDANVTILTTPSHLFFTSDEALWATDGSAAGTLRVGDFAPPSCGPDDCPFGDVASPTASGDRVYFASHRAGHAIEIWESDGTVQGTRPRIELPARITYVDSLLRVGGHWLFPAALDFEPVFWTVDEGFTRAARLTACGGGICPQVDTFATIRLGSDRLIFYGGDGVCSTPWVTDGTAAGTRRLADDCRLVYDLEDPIRPPGVSGPAYFRVETGEDGTGADQLWRTDGTPEGTRRIVGHAKGVGFFKGLIYYGSSFGSRFGNTGQGHLAPALWATDGTPGAERRIAVLRRFEAGSAPVFQPFQNGVLIMASHDDGQSELWRSDGTPAGTFPLHDFAGDTQPSYARFLGRLGSVQLLFHDVELPYVNGPTTADIWRTDGTPQGTSFLASLPFSGFADSSIEWQGELLFDVTYRESCALWRSDGTAAGTHRLLPAVPYARCPWLITALGSRFLYAAFSGDDPRVGLFVSDGTAAGTREIASFDGYFDLGPLRVGGTVFFRVVSGVTGTLWQTDGTAAGTRVTTALLDPSDLQEFAGSLYLTAALSADPDAGRALFRISSPGGSPVQLAKLFQYSVAPLVPMQFSPLGDRLVFALQDFHGGFQVWATDGTPAGTRRIHTFQPTPDLLRDPELLTAAGGRAFFAASDGVHGRELWETDGTSEGTRMVADLAPGGFSSMPADSSFAVTKDFLFFAADDSKTGLEPWAFPLEPQ